MSVEYRKVLYANYHTTQSGRASLTSAESLFLREKRQFESEILPLLYSVSKSARIFDMGCGSGSLLKGLKEAGYTNLIGMDLSEEQVNMAHEFGVSEVVLGDAMQFSAVQKSSLISSQAWTLSNILPKTSWWSCCS